MSAQRGEDSARRIQRITYMNLVVACLVDGRIDPAEAWVLRSAARILGIDDRSAEFWTEMVVRTRKLILKIPEPPKARELCFDLMVAACRADGVVRPEELRMLKKVAPQFGVSGRELVEKVRSLTVEEIEARLSAKAPPPLPSRAGPSKNPRPGRASRREGRRRRPDASARTAEFIPEPPAPPKPVLQAERVAKEPAPTPEEPAAAARERAEAVLSPEEITRIKEDAKRKARADLESVEARSHDPAGLAGRAADSVGPDPVAFMEKPVTGMLGGGLEGLPALPALELPELDFSAAALSLGGPGSSGAPSAPAGAGAEDAPSPQERLALAARAVLTPKGPGRLKGIYCWYRGEKAGAGEGDLAGHFLAEHTDADVAAAGCRVETVYGGDLQFALNPRDGLLFDFSFRVPGGIGDEDVVLEGRCECGEAAGAEGGGVREFALLLDFE